jgi:hypothetical protein
VGFICAQDRKRAKVKESIQKPLVSDSYIRVKVSASQTNSQ